MRVNVYLIRSALSLFTRPETVAVNVGSDSPKVLDLASAVTVTGAGRMVNVFSDFL